MRRCLPKGEKEGEIMNKMRLLPVMAYRSVKQNKLVYRPYLMACFYAVFSYYLFASLLHNDLMERLPKAAYAWMMLSIGKGLLSVILLLFLLYAGSFLQKKRKRELGLYSLLGLERKHIGIMLLWETAGMYLVSVIAGIVLGFVLNKLMFLLLLRMSRLNVEAAFYFSPEAVVETFRYFAIVFLCIYSKSLLGLFRLKPTELMAESKKGEKEVKRVWLWSVVGMALLVEGYYISVTSKLDSMIFTDFFLAVFLVVLGTYFLFTSGSAAFLKSLKQIKSFYYRPANQVTISGMLYRMKRNAAGLSNICIFSTMLLITLTCTVTLWMGMDQIAYYDYPYDLQAVYSENSDVIERAAKKARELSEKYGQAVKRLDFYDAMQLSCGKAEGSNVFSTVSGLEFADQYSVTLMTLDDYNRLEGQNKSLKEGEVLLYSTGREFGFDKVDFLGVEAKVSEEPEKIYPYPRAKNRMFNFTAQYVMVVRDEATKKTFVTAWAQANGVTDIDGFLHSGVRYLCLLLDTKESERDAFIEEWSVWCQGQQDFLRLENGLEGRIEDRSMNGGLLFIGMVFGILFFTCLLLIMYFKQVTEGYEDQNNFAIMQKVGMSDSEIKGTIRRQILLVFFLPLAGAFLHTAAGLVMVNGLLAALRFFDTGLLIRCCAGVAAVVSMLYVGSYLMTARTYYSIVRK